MRCVRACPLYAVCAEKNTVQHDRRAHTTAPLYCCVSPDEKLSHAWAAADTTKNSCEQPSFHRAFQQQQQLLVRTSSGGVFCSIWRRCKPNLAAAKNATLVTTTHSTANKSIHTRKYLSLRDLLDALPKLALSSIPCRHVLFGLLNQTDKRSHLLQEKNSSKSSRNKSSSNKAATKQQQQQQ